jgi:hypothetical protein
MNMTDHLSELASDLRNRRIEAPDSFADDVMGKISRQNEGGFKSLPVPARIVLSTIVIAIYCSLGILLGVKGYQNLKPEGESSSNKELVELMRSHYISPDFFEDPIFTHLNSKN